MRRAAWSTGRFRYRAAIWPSGMAVRRMRASERAASSRVYGSSQPSAVDTGWPAICGTVRAAVL